MDLHRLVDDPLRGLGREQLGHRGAPGDLRGRRAGVVRRGGRPDEQPCGLGAGRHLGQRVLDRLLPDQDVAVDLTGQRPVEGGVERGLGHPDRERAHARAEQVEGAHRHREPAADLAQDVGRGDPDPVEVQPPDRVRGQQVERFTGESVGVARHGEGGDAPGPVGPGPREHGVDVGLGCVGDPGLLAVQPPRPVAVGGRGQGQGRGVRPGAGLREREGGDGGAGHDPGDPALHQRRRTGLEDRIAAQPLQGQRGLGLGRDGRQRLAQQAELQRRGVAGRLVGGAAEESAEQPVLAERGEQRPVDGAVDRLDREQVVGGDRADPGDVLLLLVRQPDAHARDRIAP